MNASAVLRISLFRYFECTRTGLASALNEPIKPEALRSDTASPREADLSTDVEAYQPPKPCRDVEWPYCNKLLYCGFIEGPFLRLGPRGSPWPVLSDNKFPPAKSGSQLIIAPLSNRAC